MNNDKMPQFSNFVVVMTDGHSSRFDLEILRFVRLKTSTYCTPLPARHKKMLQPLDQISQMIHSAYNEGKKTLFVGVIDASARAEGENTGTRSREGLQCIQNVISYYQVRLLYDYSQYFSKNIILSFN